MSLIIARNFKRTKVQDAAAQDIKLPFIITFNNGKKEFREGYSEEEVRRRFDKSVAALYGGIKSIKLEDEDKRNGKDSIAAGDDTARKFKPNDLVEWRDAHGRHNSAFYVRDNGDRITVSIEKNGQGGGLEIPKAWITNYRAADAKDSIAADAQFKVGDKVKHAKVKFPVQPIGRISEVYDDPRWVEVEWENAPYKYQTIETSNLLPANSRAADACAADAKFKIGDKVKLSGSHPRFPNKVGVVTHVFPTGFVKVKVDGAEDIEIAERLISAADSCATDYDPNPQTRGKDIEVFSAQAIREESACENVLRKVIEDVEALVIKIHGPMSSWEEVIENSEMSPELPQAKKWSGTANRRYDYLLARERAISSILSELKRNHID